MLFGIFLRSLAGLDREAAKQALNKFLAGKTNTANQIVFLNLIVDHLVEYGLLDPVLLYRSPIQTSIPKGPEGLFTSNEIVDLISVLDDVKKRAIA